MGFYVRKSFKAGPFKINLSKSGIGTSLGVKGFRISTGPKGTNLHAGRGGLYYRKKLSSAPNQSRLQESSTDQIITGVVKIIGIAMICFLILFLLSR